MRKKEASHRGAEDAEEGLMVVLKTKERRGLYSAISVSSRESASADERA